MKQNRIKKWVGMLAGIVVISSLVACASPGSRASNGSEAGAAGLEIVARLATPPGNVTVSSDGRIFVSTHQHFAVEPRMAEIVDGGALRAFPNEAWNDPERPHPERLDSVLGVQYDTKGILWMLDNGMRSGVQPKLVGWDVAADTLYKVIELPQAITREDSFLNDLAVDRDRDFIYIADPTRGAHPAIIVVHIPTGSARRVLEAHPSVVADSTDLVINRQAVEIRRPDGSTFRPRVGINPIAIDANNEWLYYGPMHGTALYRVRTADLANAKMADARLATKVEFFGNKPISDGSTMDRDGAVYISDIGNNAIGKVNAQGSYIQLFQDDTLLQWPDSFSFGPEGWCYVLINQLHLGPVLNAGEDSSKPPYVIARFKVPAGGVVGR